MSVNYKLISFSFCPYVQRPRIAMLEKHMPHRVEYIDLNSPPSWFHEISPLEKVPVLLVDEEPLFESMAICEYVNEVDGISLYPQSVLERARHRAWIELVNEPLHQLHTMVTAQDETSYKRAHAILADRLDIVEENLGDGPYFAGEDFGMVDAVYAPLFRFMQFIHTHCGVPLIAEDTPKIARWAEQLLRRPSVTQAVPESFDADYGGFISRQSGPLAQKIKN